MSIALNKASKAFGPLGSQEAINGFLNSLESNGHIDGKTLKEIKEDEGLMCYFTKAPKKTSKKSSKKESSKKSSDEDRNKEVFDAHRCSARVWKPEGGKSYDKVQCHSKNIVTMDDVSEILGSFGMENPYRSVDEFKETYGGCFCKKHLAMDFFMPKGYFLGKVNEPRPETPMLPKGSVKKGYTEEYKAHYWLYGPDGKKVETRTRKSEKKSKSPSKTASKTTSKDSSSLDLNGDVQSMKVSELKKKAKSIGIERDAIEEADDSENVKETLIELIRSKESELKAEEDSKAEPKEEPVTEAEEKEEDITTMKVSDLKKKAKSIGVDQDALEEADDSENVKETLIKLILSLTDKAVEESDASPPEVNEETSGVEEDGAPDFEDDSGEEGEDDSSDDEEDKEDIEFSYEGVDYLKHWDSDSKEWVVLTPEDYYKVGVPTGDDDNGIEFTTEGESLHKGRMD